MCAKNSYSKTLLVGDKTYQICDVGCTCEELKSGSYTKLPYSLKILAENIVRAETNQELCAKALEALIKRSREVDLPYRPSRVVFQDLLGTPALVDLVGLRNAIADKGGDPWKVNPVVPAHMIIDHSLNTECWGSANAMERNMEIEQKRNAERFDFLSWCNKAFDNLAIIPSGTGIVHQINLERLTPVIAARKDNNGILQAYPDTLVGTDSHTTMINAAGVLGWGVGGIEAEAAMLGKALTLRLPEIVRIQLEGTPQPGIMAMDISLALTQTLRKAGVVGAYLEFAGTGISRLTLADRATIANMGPEYGVTTALFPIDDRTIEYLRMTGRTAESCELVKAYAVNQGLWHNKLDAAEYDRTIIFDLSTVKRAIAGPKNPHQLIPLESVKDTMQPQPSAKSESKPTLPDGAVVIASITSCTNTSNPREVIAAALLARRANQLGLARATWTKTSFAPGSRAVAKYLSHAGLDIDLNALGFNIIGFACATCNGMSGPLISEELEQTIKREGTATVAVTSGNRNFEGRVHPLAREVYIASPPLVVAYAIAGTSRIDFEREHIGHDKNGKAVFLKELWPSDKEIEQIEQQFVTSELFAKIYADVPVEFSASPENRKGISPCYEWDAESTYIRRPPYWTDSCRATDPVRDLVGMLPLVMLGDHITTDHISPSGAILPESDAGRYLISHGITKAEFNSYGTRRGNHEVGMRATFASPRLKNELVNGKEGPFTKLLPDGTEMTIFNAATEYAKRNQPLMVIAGREYGSGSSRDWAAKGPRLLGVRVVLAESFERIHRSNLAGMGILPVEFTKGETRVSLSLNGLETFDLEGVDKNLEPRKILTLRIHRPDGSKIKTSVLCRLDTNEEIHYFHNGGLLPHLLIEHIAAKKEIKKCHK